MNNKLPFLSEESIEAVIRGEHKDPFSVLGPHLTADGLIVRTFVPQALFASVVDIESGEKFAMERINLAGFFECHIKGRETAFDYQIEITFESGGVLLYEDPYAFPDLMSGYDEYLLAEGTHIRMYDKLGAHVAEINNRSGVRFAVWAPNALRVSVVGEFNQWDGRRHPMRQHHNSGIWDIFIPGLDEGTLYKYEIKGSEMPLPLLKSDPVGFFSELRPKTASIVWNLDKHKWHDADWMNNRDDVAGLDRPINVYEVHLGSWRRNGENEWLTYQEFAGQLIPYVKEMGYTHVELLPVAEHPLDGSWGYQVAGYFAATSRFGVPEDFMAFVDACHQEKIGVILDWVPAHFPRDAHGLAYFDGTFLYEHADPVQGSHPDWGTLIFNYGRNEVRQFLISNAIFWLEKYHIDGLRVDAVASMLYLDFSREAGGWVPNRYGGRENIEAIEFIRQFNDAVHSEFPGTLTIAEESTAWPGVTKSVSEGGLGFDLKWNMGWMHDTLQYMAYEPIHRSYHHGTLTFSLLYAFSERFLLPFSHDEVVHLKRSMVDKMPGDLWQKFANIRLLYVYQIAHPGKKMLFMGGEFGQWREWNEANSLDWHLLEQSPVHSQLQSLVKDVNHIYTKESALYQDDYSWKGFTWLDLQDSQRSILSFARHDPQNGDSIIVAFNFTPVVREDYRLGVPAPGQYKEILNSDATKFGGSGVVNKGLISSQETAWHDQSQSIQFRLPPLSGIFLKKSD
jgi:1,4-alpha-glucan branching enzyme